MPNTSPTTWHNSDPYSVQAACEHCGNVLQHEAWCFTRNTAVRYAYQIIHDPSKLTIGDTLILHSLGVTWVAKAGVRKSGTSSETNESHENAGNMRL
jgi:hypothetical protein